MSALRKQPVCVAFCRQPEQGNPDPVPGRPCQNHLNCFLSTSIGDRLLILVVPDVDDLQLNFYKHHNQELIFGIVHFELPIKKNTIFFEG